MGDRSEELRRRHRRVLGWSMGIAILAHVALFAFSPEFRTVLPGTSPVRAGSDEGGQGELRWIDVTFGPPTIYLGEGVERVEPPERWLQAREVDITGLALDADCQWVRRADLTGTTTSMDLVVAWDGRIADARVADGSGDACVDEVMLAVARTLWYRWLPDDDAPAPVEVLQPMQVTDSN